jgi:hypothetical protein
MYNLWFRYTCKKISYILALTSMCIHNKFKCKDNQKYLRKKKTIKSTILYYHKNLIFLKSNMSIPFLNKYIVVPWRSMGNMLVHIIRFETGQPTRHSMKFGESYLNLHEKQPHKQSWKQPRLILFRFYFIML